MVQVLMRRREPEPGPGFDVYWQFAAERQRVYFRKLEGDDGSGLTEDPVIRAHRFTNAYRASDRVSQYLIANVIYDAERNWADTFVRVLLFKLFNRIDTWETLSQSIGDIGSVELFSGAVDDALELASRGRPIYNAAYIMPPPRNGSGPKFRRHLDLLRWMVQSGAHHRLAEAHTMESAFGVLASYDSIGPFLAFQFLIDLNYTTHLSFSESDFVVAGPGALRGIRKCFSSLGEYSPGDLIRWVADQQEHAFVDRHLDWSNLWGRPLQLIDAQNLFCEVDKYTRQANPELPGNVPGSRIKQRYVPSGGRMTAWFPPKWGINEAVPERLRRGLAPFGQLDFRIS